jgi:hypothetical protein
MNMDFRNPMMALTCREQATSHQRYLRDAFIADAHAGSGDRPMVRWWSMLVDRHER